MSIENEMIKEEKVPDTEKNGVMILDIETDGTEYIIEIAYNIYDDDLELIEKKDFVINEDVGKIDFYKKFTLEDIKNEGVHPIIVLEELANDMLQCKYIIGHNINFDLRHIGRYYKKYDIIYEFPHRLDTMQLSRTLVGAKDKNGRIKFPRLSELYEYLFQCAVEEEECHRADFDVYITYKCCQGLIERDIMKLK